MTPHQNSQRGAFTLSRATGAASACDAPNSTAGEQQARVTQKISSISTMDELDGYEAQARTRGFSPEELRPLKLKRDELTPRNRRK